jgi:hypothetical protein
VTDMRLDDSWKERTSSDWWLVYYLMRKLMRVLGKKGRSGDVESTLPDSEL